MLVNGLKSYGVSTDIKQSSKKNRISVGMTMLWDDKCGVGSCSVCLYRLFEKYCISAGVKSGLKEVLQYTQPSATLPR